MAKFIDETGNVYGRLTVVARAAQNQHGRAFWLCVCSCGKQSTAPVDGVGLRNGVVKSCGCLQGRRYETFNEAAFNTVIYGYKRDAERRGYIWDLSDEQCRVLFKAPCFYCGDAETNSRRTRDKVGSVFKYNGIDRLDSSIGYVITNVVSCCFIDNRAKNNMTSAAYEAWLDRLVAHRNRIS